MRLHICASIVLFFALCAPAFSQKVRLKQAGSLRGEVVDGIRFDRLFDNVVFIQKSTTIYCDEAQFFRAENRVEAFGHIRIQEGDSISITASSLSYDGNARVAHLRDNIVFRKLGMMALYTDFLDYDRNAQRASYLHGGKLIDRTDTLTSEHGYYDVETNMVSFKKNVVGKSDGYTFYSDTIQYDVDQKTIFFRDISTIRSAEGDTMVYKSGSYSTQDKSFLLRQGVARNASYTLAGEECFLDVVKKIYRVNGNLAMTYLKDSISIYGDRGYYDQTDGLARVYGNAYMARPLGEGDTLFMSADTLLAREKRPTPSSSLPTDTLSQEDGKHILAKKAPLAKVERKNAAAEKKKRKMEAKTVAPLPPPGSAPKETPLEADTIRAPESKLKKDSVEKMIFAYRRVRLFSKDFRGAADSLVFSSTDSTLRLFNSPILWLQDNQITSDSMRMRIVKNNIERVEFIEKPFMVSKDSLLNFNQMKGRQITAYFKEGKVDYVHVDGNGEGLYFVLDKERQNDAETSFVVGANHVLCSSIKVFFGEKRPTKVGFYGNPEASFMPPSALEAKNPDLEGFTWREEEKPSREDVVKRPYSAPEAGSD